MKRLHTLLYCIYLERNKKTLCIEEGISLYKWVYENGLNKYSLEFTYSINELKKEIKMFLK